jgi:hypothetical protein
MAVNLSPSIRQRFFDSNGNPLSGGKLYCYQAGTSTPQPTYTDSSGVTPNDNPVILDASGYANVWLNVALSYKFVLTDSLDNQQWSVDNVIGLTAANAVSTASIQDLAVTTAKLADNSVTAAKLSSDTTIDSNRAVTSDHIRNGAINRSKMDNTTTASVLDLKNLSLSASVSSNALTVAIKTASGTNPSVTDNVTVGIRSTTATSGGYDLINLTSAISIIIPASTTIGTVSSASEYIYVYLINNSGSLELALSLMGGIDSGSITSTTAIAGGSSRSTLYSTTARSNVPTRLIGRIKITEATAGTWASSPTEVSILPFSNLTKDYARVSITNQSVSSNNPIVFSAKTDDTLGSIDLTTGRYTAKIAGFRTVSGYIDYGTASSTSTQIWKGGSSHSTVGSAPSTFPTMNIFGSLYLAVNEYFDLRPTVNQSFVNSNSHITIINHG